MRANKDTGDESTIVSMASSRSLSTSLQTSPGFPVLHLSSSASGKIFGREKETRTLVECYRNSKSSKQLVSIHGEAGSGKSTLAEWLRHNPVVGDGAFYSGKFTLNQQDSPTQPYAAFSQICRKMYFDMKQSEELGTDVEQVPYSPDPRAAESSIRNQGSPGSSGHLPGVRTLLKQQLGSLDKILSRVLPEILEPGHSEKQDGDCNEKASHLDERIQLQMAFRIFFRVMCSAQSTIIVIDDLQWADQASLDLIERLLQDPENSSFMMIACFRENEVGPTHRLAALLISCEEKAGDFKIELTKIKVENLTIEALNNILSDILTTNSSKDTLPLAEVIHAHTKGNAFFSLETFKTLVVEELLYFDKTARKHTWDIKQVKAMTCSSSNAVGLIQTKLKKLPTNVKNLVHLSSCLGTEIHLDTLAVIVEDYNATTRPYFNKSEDSSCGKKSCTLDVLLKTMLKLGLLYQTGEKLYRWTHDKIQEAVMVKKKHRAVTHLRVGELLLERVDAVNLAQHMFVIVRLLNDGSKLIATTNSQKRSAIADLNLRAGKKSMETAGFETAKRYFNKGIDWLPGNHGRVYAELSLELYSSAAEAEFCLGDSTGLKKHCRQVISRQHIKILDKIRAYKVLMEDFNARGRPSEAILLCIDVLAQLGCPFPKRFLLVRVIKGIIDLKALAKRGMKAELDKIPPMSDPHKLLTMQILAMTAKYAFLAGQKETMMIATCKSLRLTLECGRNDQTCYLAANTGLVFAAMGDFKIARSYAYQAREEEKTCASKATICRTRMPLNFMTLPVVGGDILSTILQAEEWYLDGMGIGLVEEACTIKSNALSAELFVGAPLRRLYPDLIKLKNEAMEFKLTRISDHCSFMLQKIENLSKESQNSSVMSGSFSDSEQQYERYRSDKDELMTAIIQTYRINIAFMFGDFDRVWLLRNQFRESRVEAALPCLFDLFPLHFVLSLSMASLARQNPKQQRKFNTVLSKLKKKLNKWAAPGNPDIVHYIKMVDAEMADLRNSPSEQVSRLFQEGIDVAVERRQINDEAIGYQRLGDFWLRRGDAAKGSHCLTKAADLFDQWGAHAKASHLRGSIGSN